MFYSHQYLIFFFLINQEISKLFVIADADEIIDHETQPYKSMPEPIINSKEKEIDYWRSQAISTLNEKLKIKLNTNTAKNVIFFMGDGMSLSTISAARIYKGQLNKQNGEEGKLFFEKFPFTGLSKTYCVDRQVADSASTSTAYLSGVKANYGTIGVSANVKLRDCEAAKNPMNQPTSIIKWAQNAGKATGVVTTTRITHASPAGAYSHVCNRGFECDSDINPRKYDMMKCDSDIAKQMVYEDPGRNINVLMGGGRMKFLPEKDEGHGTGKRLDKDLIVEWKKLKKDRKANAVYVTTSTELEKVNATSTDFLLGLFADNHLEDHLFNSKDQPTLSQMTEKAIKILQNDKIGFFLFVEGGNIDLDHHGNFARRALDETIEFDKAVETAVKLTNEEDTLIVVTADHSHVMSISGYPARGYDILGIYGRSSQNYPYATLSYANGPGYRKESAPGVPYDLQNDNTADLKYRYPAMVPKEIDTHGGEDVVVFARGPWAHLFTGNFEQNYIPIAEAFAAEIPVLPTASKSNQNTIESDTKTDKPTPVSPNRSSKLIFSYSIIISTLLLVTFC